MGSVALEQLFVGGARMIDAAHLCAAARFRGAADPCAGLWGEEDAACIMKDVCWLLGFVGLGSSLGGLDPGERAYPVSTCFDELT